MYPVLYGRLFQRQNISVTQRRSQVRTLHRPPNNRELPEWSIGASWKGDGRENGTRVRLPHSLPMESYVSWAGRCLENSRIVKTVRVRFSGFPPEYALVMEFGIHTSLRDQVLQVRLLPWAPNISLQFKGQNDSLLKNKWWFDSTRRCQQGDKDENNLL